MAGIVKLRDGRIAGFRVIGSGIPALMIPSGRGTGASYLASSAGQFPHVLRSHLVDPPGSGMSSPAADPAGCAPCAHARFYEEARKALDLSRVVVLGHSFGATVALAYAALYPQSTAACVAVAPFGADSGAGTAWLARIRRPTLVVAGENDPAGEPGQATRIAREIPGAQLTVLPDCGQLPALEAPEAHREVVIDFLRANR